MASKDSVRYDLKTPEVAKNEKLTAARENRPKERICDKVLRDEDEETDDEDLNLNPSSGEMQTEETDSALDEEDIEDVDTVLDDIEDDEPSDTTSIIPETVIQFADGILSVLPPRWRNFITRGMSGLSLISGFTIIVLMGPIGLIFVTFLVIYHSFCELIKLGAHRCNVEDKATKRLCWFIFFLALYFLDGKACIEALDKTLSLNEDTQHTFEYSSDLGLMSFNIVCNTLRIISRHHIAVVASMYLLSIIWFVATIGYSNFVGRYTLLAWSHMSAFFLAVPAHCAFNILFQGGTIFYIVPMIVITINDICAYYVGFLIGKTPLIKLSPKKTMEGYIGGGILTVILGTAFTKFCVAYGYPSLTCPAKPNYNYFSIVLSENSTTDSTTSQYLSTPECNLPEVFLPQNYQITQGYNIELIPFVMVHGLFISIFAATLGPFGGFFASGFKRACRRKNFGNMIPGHGGVIDRCDCMLLMQVFIYVYLNVLQEEGIMPKQY